MCNRCVGVFRAAGVFRPQIPLPCIDLQSLALPLLFDGKAPIQVNYTRLCEGDEIWSEIAIHSFMSRPAPCPRFALKHKKHVGTPP